MTRLFSETLESQCERDSARSVASQVRIHWAFCGGLSTCGARRTKRGRVAARDRSPRWPGDGHVNHRRRPVDVAAGSGLRNRIDRRGGCWRVGMSQVNLEMALEDRLLKTLIYQVQLRRHDAK
uniref:Uncharacterized protein n=1 Tax=Steinernema glaseri TaxID=37863 RepID=A0A1I7YKG9_9BILA